MTAGLALALKLCTPKKAIYTSDFQVLFLLNPSLPLLPRHLSWHSGYPTPRLPSFPTLVGLVYPDAFLIWTLPPIPGILWGRGGSRLFPLPALVFNPGFNKPVAHLPLINLAFTLPYPALSSWDHTPQPWVCSLPSPPSPCLYAYSRPDTLQLTDTVVTVLFLYISLAGNLRLRFWEANYRLAGPK